jgi:membrane-associated phospholipid phosphatase
LSADVVDYRLYHAVNSFVADHAWLGRAGAFFEKWAVPLYAAAAICLWLLARPGGNPKWKLASASSLASAALALLINQLVAKVWDRPRPFATHPSAHVWGGRSHDPSFPSDHSSAAFAIAFAILLFDTLAGALFLVAAALIAIGRVVVGAHYPGDVAAGVLVGLASALIVVKLARPVLAALVRLASRLIDPIVAPFWNRAALRRSR